MQKEKVMRAIYASDGIKCGHRIVPAKMLTEVAESLIERGAQAIISGCTEVSIVIKNSESSWKVFDPLEIIASVAINMAWCTAKPV